MLNDRLVFDAMVINRISFSLYNPFASTDAKAGFFTEESSGCHIRRIIETKEETGKLVYEYESCIYFIEENWALCQTFRISRQ